VPAALENEGAFAASGTNIAVYGKAMPGLAWARPRAREFCGPQMAVALEDL
jgi:hypothetical protein